MIWQFIIGLTISSGIVLLAVYLMFRQYFKHQAQTFLIKSRRGREQRTLPLKLQAYERLLLLCERMDIAEMVLRLKTPGTSAAELHAAMIMAVQQEYEHNITQQLYISDELWNVMILAKNKTMDLFTLAMQKVVPGASAAEYVNMLFELASKEQQLPSQIAKKAIRAESSLLL